MADWVTISSLATAGGTLVLAGATFASVRSANRASRVAERSLLAGLRPLLMPSRLEDPPQKIGFVDGKWLHVPGSCGAAETSDEAVYLADVDSQRRQRHRRAPRLASRRGTAEHVLGSSGPEHVPPPDTRPLRRG